MERQLALDAPLRGPGFALPRASDMALFHDVPRAASGWWGALPGEYILSAPTYPAFTQMLRDARVATKADCHHPAPAPVTVGFWPDFVGLSLGGPFLRCDLRDCPEVWHLSTDDWARLLLHVLYHGQRSSVLTTADVPPCVWRLLAESARRIDGLSDTVAGVDVVWRALPGSDPSPASATDRSLRERRALVFVFLACKLWVAKHSCRYHLRGVWAQFLHVLQTHTWYLPRREAVAALSTVGTAIADVHRPFFHELCEWGRDVRHFLRDRLVDDGLRSPSPTTGPLGELWTAAGRLAILGRRITTAPDALRWCSAANTTQLVVIDQLMRSLQFHAVNAAHELGEGGTWERIEGATTLDWQLSPYEGATAFCTHDISTDAPTLWLQWRGDARARRHHKTVGWLRLVVQGRVAQPVLPLAPLLTTALLAVTDASEAVALLLPWAALWDRRAPPQPAEWVRDAVWPLLKGAVCLPLALVVFRIAGKHSVRTRALSALLPLLPNVPKWLARLTQMQEEFASVPDENVLAFVHQLCASAQRGPVGAWVAEHWRTIPFTVPLSLAPPATAAYCADAEVLAAWRTLPAAQTTDPVRCLWLAPSHRVRRTALEAVKQLATGVGAVELREWLPPSPEADAQGFVAVPLDAARGFWRAVAAQPVAVQQSVHGALAVHWQTDAAPRGLDLRAAGVSPGTAALEPGKFLDAPPAHVWSTLQQLEVAVRGEQCQWAGLDADSVLRVEHWPVVRDGWRFRTLGHDLPLLCDRNAEPLSSPVFREFLRARLPLASLRLNPADDPRGSSLGLGSMEIEAAVHADA